MPRGQARRRSAAEEDGKKKRRRGFAVEGGRRRNRKKTPFSNRQFHPIFRLALRKDEYTEISTVLCRSLGCATPVEISRELASWPSRS